ncbi:MAG: reverse transcriptase domain-containing protein [Candidatus Limnocylindrales bacterium]
MHDALRDRRRYERQIDRLHQRHLFDGGLHRLTDGEVTLSTVVMHRAHVAKLLARTVELGQYELRPATIRTIVVEGRERVVFDHPVLDRIVHGVVAEALTEVIDPKLSKHVYSYRRGVSSMVGVAALARYVRRHWRDRPDPATRGLYVLRRDIDAYTDSIPVGPDSLLWTQLRGAMHKLPGHPPSEADWRLIEQVVRPTVIGPSGQPIDRTYGVPTGQPISVVCFNLYLADIDHELSAIPGSFYARYSDDLVFAHPDAAVVRQASEVLDGRVSGLGLRLNQNKARDLYFTGSGRVSADWPETKGTTGVVFLGMRVTMDGTVALGPRKVRGLLRDARRRAANTAGALPDADVDARGRAAAAALNSLLDEDEAQLRGAPVPMLAHVVTDRKQLEELDHELALIVAMAATGLRGPKAFRTAPYRTVRSEWGLASLRRGRDRNQG